ncbi:hypothetical protein ACWEVO_25775, partial [Micromonospora sp. NPDC003776]
MHWTRPARAATTALLGLGLLVPGHPAPLAPAAYVEAYPVTAARLRAAGPPYDGWPADGRHFLVFDPRDPGQHHHGQRGAADAHVVGAADLGDPDPAG